MKNSDRDLVAKTREGDQQAFEILVNRYLRVVGGIAFNVIGDYHLASDIAQEAFLKAYRNLHQLSDPGKFKSWLANIAKTTAIDWRRKRKPQVPFSSDDDSGGSVADFLISLTSIDPEIALGKKELEELVQSTLQQMPDDYREVLILKHMEELSYQEIADVLGTTTSAVESRLFRARKHIQKKFQNLF